MKTLIALIPVSILYSAAYAQVGDTTAGKEPVQMEEVTVTAEMTLVTQEADRIVYDMQADPQSKVNSLLDMMRKVPYLSVDGEENVLLNGSSSYKIFIDDRPSGLIAANPKEALRSIAASTVKSIEVITSPPSRYDAEGLAGIINIITLKQHYEGYRATVNTKYTGPVGGPGGGLSFTLKSGRFGINVIAGAGVHNNPETGSELRRTTAGKSPANLFQQTISRSAGYSVYPGVALSWEFDSLNLVSGELSMGNNKTEGSSATIALLNTGNVEQQYNLNNSNIKKGSGIEGSVNYQHGFKANKDQILTFSYRHTNDDDQLRNDVVFSDEINAVHPDYRQSNSERFAEHTGQIDYTHPFKLLTAEGGIKGIFRETGSDFQHEVQNANTRTYEIDISRAGVFNYYQDVLAAYNNYACKFPKWQLKAGLRAEQTLISGTYSKSAMPIQHQYFNLLPSAFINRKLSTKSSLSCSYTRRIQRPSTDELNPFVNRSNPNFESSGNPYLQPITSNVFQLSYLLSAKASFNISLGGIFFNNVFNPFPIYDSARDITTNRVENLGKGRVLKVNMFLNYPISSKWNFTANSDIRHVQVNGIAVGTPVQNSGVDVYVYSSTGYSFSNDWKLNADITFKKGGLLLPIGRTNGFVASSFSISKSILSSRLTFAAMVSNPFNKYRYNNETVISSDFFQAASYQLYFRRYTFTLNYRFGKLKTDIKKSKKTIETDDLTK